MAYKKKEQLNPKESLLNGSIALIVGILLILIDEYIIQKEFIIQVGWKNFSFCSSLSINYNYTSSFLMCQTTWNTIFYIISALHSSP